MYPLAVIASYLLCSCTTIPLTSIPALRRIDFRTTDIGKVRIAISVPPEFGLLKPPGYFNYSYQVQGEAAHQEALALEESLASEDKTGIAIEDSPPGSSIHVLHLPPSSAARLAKLRSNEQQRIKSEGKKGYVHFSFGGNFCKKTEPPAGPILTTTFVKTIETGTWVTFNRNWNVRAEKAVEDAVAKLEKCK